MSSHAFREHIWTLGARPAIPSKQNEAPVACPDWVYDNRNHVERLWARLKEWRAIATRYEKTASSFMGVLCLVVFQWPVGGGIDQALALAGPQPERRVMAVVAPVSSKEHEAGRASM